MSTTDHAGQMSDAVNLAAEEAVKQILVSSVLGLWPSYVNWLILRQTASSSDSWPFSAGGGTACPRA
jgi:hypothetical protein